MLVNGQFMPKLVDKEGKEIFPIEKDTVTSTIGSVNYIKQGNIVIYTANFNTSSINSGATTLVSKLPFYNSNMNYVGSAVERVGDVTVNHATLHVTTSGQLRAFHTEYGNQVEFIGSVVVMLE